MNRILGYFKSATALVTATTMAGCVVAPAERRRGYTLLL